MDRKTYKESFNDIKAPESLVQSTLQGMEDERRRTGGWMYRLAAACVAFVFLAGSLWIYQSQTDKINIEEVADMEIPGYSVGVLTGKVGEAGEQKGNYRTEIYTDREFLPEKIWDVNPSRINNQQVYICYDQKQQVYYAMKEEGDEYTFISGQDTTEEDFVNYLKSYFETEKD